jgi:hypothetical protein
MQGDDDKIPRGIGRRNEWKELRCRNSTHFGIFGPDAAFNKTKRGTRCPSARSTSPRRPKALQRVAE